MQNLSNHETDLVAAMMKFFIVDWLVFGGVGCAFDQKDRAACGLAQRLCRSVPTSGPVVFLLEQGEDLQIALDIFSPICRGR